MGERKRLGHKKSMFVCVCLIFFKEIILMTEIVPYSFLMQIYLLLKNYHVCLCFDILRQSMLWWMCSNENVGYVSCRSLDIISMNYLFI